MDEPSATVRRDSKRLRLRPSVRTRTANDFLSVAIATFLRARFDSPANLSGVSAVSVGCDGCRVNLWPDGRSHGARYAVAVALAVVNPSEKRRKFVERKSSKSRMDFKQVSDNSQINFGRKML